MSNEQQSGKMWSGRFREPLDAEFEAWQRSIVFDWRLLDEEIAASKAHASALCAAGILSEGERAEIRNALDTIAVEFASEAGKAEVRDHSSAEDIHHFVELTLADRIGPLGLKLHTGRSRNEQIATDLRLYVRSQIELVIDGLAAWALALVEQARKANNAVMPSYTHLQRAEPVLVAHWMLAYVEMALRDASRLADCAFRLNMCPLGSGAVAGATLAVDRAIAASELNFNGPTINSIDATSDRDFILEYLQALTFVGLHLSRFAEEITLFATAEFGFVILPEAFSTGSSAMPQKKNPDLTELLRAKVGRLNGAAQTVTLQLKGLPLAYNKDMQETQEPAFAADFVPQMLKLVARFTAAIEFHRERMSEAAQSGYLNAMAAATYLVHKGVPFRLAHEKIGHAVRFAMEKGVELNHLTLAELRPFGEEFAEDFYTAITLEATLDCHDVIGGTARQRVQQALDAASERIAAVLKSNGSKSTAAEAVHAGA
ncbi:MAG TPA: argininosuccinate lyase [Terracidiphilus sp.]|nr:argininosuccinate lyase [Terracidiphilus sp.]